MDLDYIKKLAVLMKEFDLSELSLREEDHRVTLRRGSPAVAPIVHAAPLLPASSAAASAGASAPAHIAGTVTINSPIVGTFYISPSPDAGPFVTVGTFVDEDTTVGIVEAMKVMNEIKAEVKGEIVEILVQDTTPVQYGTPLFRVKSH